jgi:hypothetical protein
VHPADTGPPAAVVWGAFAFWSPELDAVITGTINTGRVDRRPLLGAVVRALTD